MSDQLPPLDENLRALLDAAVPPSPTADFEARVLARLDASLAVPPGPGGSHGGGPSGQGGAPAASAAAGGGLVTLGKGTLALAGLLLAATGGVAGVVLDRTLLATPAPVPVVATPTAIARAPEPPAPVPVAAAEPVDAGQPAAPRHVERAAPPRVEPKGEPVVAPEPTAPAGSRDLALSAERALLEVARTALARGEVPQALEALERHQREAPGGRLVEEREALFVQALVRAGKRDAAVERAAAFRVRFPDSLLLPSVDAALAP